MGPYFLCSYATPTGHQCRLCGTHIAAKKTKTTTESATTAAVAAVLGHHHSTAADAATTAAAVETTANYPIREGTQAHDRPLSLLFFPRRCQHRTSRHMSSCRICLSVCF